MSLCVQSTDEDQSRQGHVVVLELQSVKMSDAASYECLIKPYDGAAVAATVNFTVYGKIYLYFSALSLCKVNIYRLICIVIFRDHFSGRVEQSVIVCVCVCVCACVRTITSNILNFDLDIWCTGSS